MINNSESEDGPPSIWEQIEAGVRNPIDIIYVAADRVILDEIVEWGNLTGWWSIRLVRSVKAAIDEFRCRPCDLIILLGVGIRGAQTFAEEAPHIPISVASQGGWSGFPKGYPPQVVVAQWAAPRSGEFADAVEDALSHVSTELIFTGSAKSIVVVSNVSDELLRRLAEYPDDRFSIDPRIFEETVAELLSRMGYDVVLTPRSGDKGRDVIAALATPTAPVLMLVECKRYARDRKVGPEPISRVWSRIFDDKANMAMVVTTSSFTPVAKEFANARGYQLSLQDGDKYISWIRSVIRRGA